MKKIILVVFACFKEADSILYQSKIKFKKEAKNKYTGLYKNNQIILLISGIGRKAATRSLKALLTGDELTLISLIIKAGTCAVIDPTINILKPLIPYRLYCNDKNENINFSNADENFLKKINIYRTDKILATLEKVLSNKKQAEYLSKKEIALADMETFYLFKNFKNFPFIPVLVGTDRGDKNVKKDFLININKASEILKKTIVEILDEI